MLHSGVAHRFGAHSSEFCVAGLDELGISAVLGPDILCGLKNVRAYLHQCIRPDRDFDSFQVVKRLFGGVNDRYRRLRKRYRTTQDPVQVQVFIPPV